MSCSSRSKEWYAAAPGSPGSACASVTITSPPSEKRLPTSSGGEGGEGSKSAYSRS